MVKLGYALILLSLSTSGLCANNVSSSRKESQKNNLDALGFEIWAQKLAGLEGGKHRVKVADILEKFGNPIETKKELQNYRDPSPSGPFQYEELVWRFDGLVLEMGSPIVSAESEETREAWIERVTISSPRYELANGLRIGQPISMYTDTLGEPTSHSDSSASYDIDNAVEVAPSVIQVTPYQISMGVDREGNVSEIEWTWWWH